MTIRKGVIDEIVARAAGSTLEVCGLLLGEGARVTGVIHCANVAPDATTTFEIAPGALLAAHKAARAGGPRLIGCYHSHPGGIPLPSRRDAADAAPNGWLWLIAAGARVELYRAINNGRWHGRFDAVEWSTAALSP